jgi:hypothetical protein
MWRYIRRLSRVALMLLLVATVALHFAFHFSPLPSLGLLFAVRQVVLSASWQRCQPWTLVLLADSMHMAAGF